MTTTKAASRAKPRSERLEARLPAEAKAIIQHAADISGRSLSDFVATSALEAAEETIRRHEVIVLSTRDSITLVEALLNPKDQTRLFVKLLVGIVSSLVPSLDNPRLRVEPLSSKHDRAAFSCGNDALDRYLREHAGQDQRRRLSAVFVLSEIESDAVAGYYTLSACEVEPSSLPLARARRLPRRPIPATLIGRLAIDLRYRGQRFGGLLLVNALARASAVSREVGCDVSHC